MVKLVSITSDAEKIISYCARVSSDNQENPEYAKLLRYCITHGHWSIFETASMTLEITTSRAIAAQLLRHRSFTFQEFSQRYSSNINKPVPIVGRRQSQKNRQSSSEELDTMAQEFWLGLQERVYDSCFTAYQQAIDSGVAREQARMLLPLATPSTLYMTGNVRSWITYIQSRTSEDTQKEHRDLANEIKKIFIGQLPTISEALEWT